MSTRLGKELPPKRGPRLLTVDEALTVAAFDEAALRIIEDSTFTTHNRYGAHRAVRVANILNDCFDLEAFRGRTIVEFGPGHYSFALLARHLGAEVVCVDRDPVFLRLGAHLGFEVVDADFYEFDPRDLGRPVHGVWLKGGFNAAALADPVAVEHFVATLTALGSEWGWCVTVNKPPATAVDPEAHVARWVEEQAEGFVRAGWTRTPIDEGDRKRYALSYMGSRYYFTRGSALPPPAGMHTGI